MTGSSLRIVVLGLSLSSSWGNGHATTYRALLKALAARGHDILFLERDVSWYAEHRDISRPGYARLEFYKDLDDLDLFRREVAGADVVIVGSYVPDGKTVGDWVLRTARGIKAFYDIDTPVTVAAVEAGTCQYLSRAQIPRYDLYLSFTGGRMLELLASGYRARAPRELYCSVDADLYRPVSVKTRWCIGYLGTYSPDRQPMLERLLFEPARQLPHRRFVVAGACFPPTLRWPANVEYIPHLGPQDHAAFYSSLAWALNVTRADMVKAGYSPSVRLFEAAACGAPLISDLWPGLGTLLKPGRELVTARGAHDVLHALSWPDERRQQIATAGRRRVLQSHSSRHRAAELEALLLVAASRARRPAPQKASVRSRIGTDPNYLRFKTEGSTTNS